MTVQDLIRYLEKLPKDTVIGVVYRACSDYGVLDESELIFYNKDTDDAASRDVGWERRHLKDRFILRNGKIMEYNPRTWDLSEGIPVFVSVLAFPGN